VNDAERATLQRIRRRLASSGFDVMSSSDRVYTPEFFRVFVATMLTMTGVSMQYHFGEYVAHVGYGEGVLGWITGIGAIGSLCLRPYAGGWIDRVGCRPTFMAAAITGSIANCSFQFVDSFAFICILRVMTVASAATFLTAVAVFAAQVAPVARRAESLGTVGIGGFLGMMIGPAIGDAIFSTGSDSAQVFSTFFTTVACVTALAGLVVFNLRSTSRELHAQPQAFFTLLRRYWPGNILVIGVVFTSTLIVHMTFLERYAHHRGFEDIRWFFLVYSPTAITFRVLCRRVPERLGRRRVCVAGLAVMSIGMLLLIPVREEWQLIFPALLMGGGHSFVFPSMVDLAAASMPLRHRGVGTSIALGAGDVGFLLGSVAWGQLIEWRGYAATFAVVAATAFAAALWFGWRERATIFARRNCDALQAAAR